MHVHNDIDRLPEFHQAAITIGTFDGVHQGHRLIISQLAQEAAKNGGESVIITFSPHPRQVLQHQDKPVKLINTIDEKVELLQASGIDHLVIVPFTKAFAQQPAQDYIRKFLVEKFHPATIIIGYDHRFGQGREGDFRMLENNQQQFGYDLIEIPAELLNDAAISSTKIRRALQDGDMQTVNACLGYPYFFQGTVIEGNKLGRKLGYPTANIGHIDPDKMLPGNGVYAVQSQINNNGTWVNGMMNIGMRPTVDGTKLSVEVNLFDFDADIYGASIKTAVISRLRAEQKFEGLDKLVEQLGRDAEHAKAVLSK